MDEKIFYLSEQLHWQLKLEWWKKGSAQ